MEKLLPNPEQTVSLPLPRQRLTHRRKGFILPRFSLPALSHRRSPMDPVIFLVLSLSLCSVGVLSHLYGASYQVSVDGVNLGAVADYRMVEEAVDRVEERASSILGHDYALRSRVEYTFSVGPKEDRIPVSQVETYLFDQIGEVMKTTVLRVNGEMVGATDDGAALDALLMSIKEPYITANTVTASFAGRVSVSREYTPTSAILEMDELESILTSNAVEQADYTVLAGDTFSEIAFRYGMDIEDLASMNPQVADISKLMVGDVLTVRRAVPFLSVRTVDHMVYEDVVPYETETVKDDSMYQGSTKVLVEGVPGQATYDANVTFLNGVEERRVINRVEVRTQPVAQVVAVGTKERPKTAATGKFIWPLRGMITSSYGSRYIFGSYSFHSGVDIAGSYGASIVAADGGRVVFSGTGTGSYWSYGKYVEIDHENGLRTIYAHCSSLNVKAGDRVYQGQVIAKVGATGRATGNHLHFQVKRWGETVSPYNYLP